MDAIELPNDEVRALLRESLRGFLNQHWPPDLALERSTDPGAIAAIWQKLVAQGIASLGYDVSEGGLREVAVAMDELGRASCPAPMLAAALVNLALTPVVGQSTFSERLLERVHDGSARVAFSFGAFNPDAGGGAVELRLGTAHGKLRFVEVAESCTHLVVVVENGPA